LIPIVADESVNPEFGTGAVKVTPGHDHTDFEIGSRHRLPILSVIGEDGRIVFGVAGEGDGDHKINCGNETLNEAGEKLKVFGVM
jgi:valyl-tRNA synthetase